MPGKRQEASNPRPDLTAKEKAGIEGALDRCRQLICQVETALMTKRTEDIRDVMALADLYASLERAAEVLRVQYAKTVERRRRSA
jgi:hypothetical protein